MKDLSIYFQNFGEINQQLSDSQLGKKMVVCSVEHFYTPEKNDVALIFVPEYRNSEIAENKEHISEIRSKLYQLHAGDWVPNIYDLGVIEPGGSVQDTYAALKDVVDELVKNGVIPIVIGGSQDLTYPIYQAYESLEQTVNILDIDAKIDLGSHEEPINNESWLSHILTHQPNYLFNYAVLGYQTYLVNHEELDLMNKLFFDAYRLGEFYQNPKIVEPLVRNADVVSFDLSAIRGSDYSGNHLENPHGLYGEDACSIMRYAGLSDKLTSLGLFNFQPADRMSFDANLIAQMLWYFVDGVSNRKRDYPIGSKNSYVKYTVSIDDFKDQINFYKSDKSARWWMEVPYPKLEGAKFQRHLLIPCNYEDYQNALENELPNLWWKTYEKLT